ncbi:hypothetical protein G9C85_08095 [Halorubellus sp. JP-L1]|uniref:hypothetical protein n=1 Tax=Halorubellus sp. JP-L1 TaxID=2715753 RepID=UPI001408788C|nr:hypothetical protein [Halorubellus sp. JP-L1]NHN41597.1 hypothetical protein [Halorubellus sp. JP-L1]
MPPDDDAETVESIETRLEDLGRYSRFSRLGLGVIVAAFAAAVVVHLPRNVDSTAAALDAVLMPTIFVGMGLLLFAIGMHLHLMHLNLVRQLRADGGSMDDSHADDDDR